MTIALSQHAVDISHGVPNASISGLTISDVHTGVHSAASSTVISDLRLTGATLGLNLAGSASIDGARLAGVQDGIQIGTDSRVSLSAVTIASSDRAITAAHGAKVVVRSSTIASGRIGGGQIGFFGSNVLPATPLSWFGVAALLAAAAALTSELLRRYRGRGVIRTPWVFPAHVTNRR
jgi:hypothetical protein